MTDKFQNLFTDDETKILFRSPMKWGDLDIVYERWNWEGITAESVIFLTEDVKEKTDSVIDQEVRDGPLLKEGSQVTIKRGDEFTFVNFNFVT